MFEAKFSMSFCSMLCMLWECDRTMRAWWNALRSLFFLGKLLFAKSFQMIHPTTWFSSLPLLSLPIFPLHSPSSKCFFTTFPVPFHHFRYSHFAFYICIHRPFPLYTLLAGFLCVCVAVVVARFPIKKHIRHASTCYCSFALLLSYIENRFVVSECLWINCFTLISRPNIQWPWLKCIHSMAWLQIRHRTNDTPEKFHEMPFSMDCILYE